MYHSTPRTSFAGGVVGNNDGRLGDDSVDKFP